MAYKFAKQSEVKELESWCMDILHAVQEEVRDYFTFDIRLIGSGDKRLVTQNSDESFDLDYNIILQRDISLKTTSSTALYNYPATYFSAQALLLVLWC